MDTKSGALSLVQAGVPSVTNDQLDLIKRTVAKDATADELKLYLFDCARQGVHPLDKLVHFTKRAGKYTPVTSIDFMRIRAAETNEYAGSDDATFTGTPADPFFAASVTVWRLVQGQRYPFTATARWSEYKPDSDFMWRKMPFTMLGKCAEGLALRKGFPRQLAGLYAKEEMDQTENSSRSTMTAESVANDTPAGYDEWFMELTAASHAGTEALKTAWDAAPVPFRAHLTKHHSSEWMSLKQCAAKVVQS